MKNIIMLCLALGLTSMMACKSKTKMVNLQEGAVKYTLKKGACYGTCPIYELKIYEGGKAEFIGERFVDKEGIHTRQLSEKEYMDLQKVIAESNFDKLKESYFDAGISDLPMTVIGCNDGTSVKTSTANNARPQSFKNIESALEKIAMGPGWKSNNPQPTPRQVEKGGIKGTGKASINEVIIKPSEKLFLPGWIKERSNYGVKLVKEIGPGVGMYLISFDPSKISQKDFLLMLKVDDNILESQVNRQVDMRN